MTDEIKIYHVDDPNDAPERRLGALPTLNPFLPTSLPQYVIPPIANSLFALQYYNWFQAYHQGFVAEQQQQQQQQQQQHLQQQQQHLYRQQQRLQSEQRQQQQQPPTTTTTTQLAALPPAPHPSSTSNTQLHPQQHIRQQPRQSSSTLSLHSGSPDQPTHLSPADQATASLLSMSSRHSSSSASSSSTNRHHHHHHQRLDHHHQHHLSSDQQSPGSQQLSPDEHHHHNNNNHHNHHHHHHLHQNHNNAHRPQHQASSPSSVSLSSQTPQTQEQQQQQPNKPHIKKPLNPFMIYMQKQRPDIVRQGTIKESAEINKMLGQQWRQLTKEEQEPYYKLAEQEKLIHAMKYPGWSARDNYANQRKKKKLKLRSISLNGTDNSDKKCRARFGLNNQAAWCKPCRRKKKCILQHHYH